MESDATDPASIAAMPEWRVSSRLDLHALWRHPPADPAYRTRPVFSHPVLNRSVVAKFNMREDEARRDLPRRLGATKLLLPLQQTRGTLIAKSLIVVPQTLETTLQAELDYRAYDLSHDVAMLQRLDWLPSLDPYVLGEMGRHFQLPFGDCYLQVPRAEQEAVAARVLAEVAPRLQWQLGLSDSPRAMPKRATVQLLAQNAGAAETDAIALRFGLNSERLSLVLLAWKALVYYRHRLSAMDGRVCRVADEIAGAAPRQPALPDELALIDLARGRVLRALTQARREALELSDALAETLGTLETQRNLERLAQFLHLAPTCMSALGERVRRLDEVCGGWTGQAPPGLGLMAPDGLRMALAGLERQLATDLTLRPFTLPRPGALARPGASEPRRAGPRFGLRPGPRD